MNERSDEQRDPLAVAAKPLLDRSVQDLDQKTVLSVQRARLAALDAASRRRQPWLRWAGGVALASMATLMVTILSLIHIFRWFLRPTRVRGCGFCGMTRRLSRLRAPQPGTC